MEYYRIRIPLGYFFLPFILCSCASIQTKDNRETIKRDNFNIQYPKSDQRSVEEAITDFVTVRISLQSQLGLDTLPPAEIIFAKDREEFDKLIQTFLGYSFHKAPSRKSLVAVTGHGKMVFLSPAVYDSQSSFIYSPESFRKLIHHETVHLFHASLNPNSDDAPKYWIEGLPWFLAAQHREESSSKPVYDSINANKIPTLNDLERDDHLSYVWGWTIAQFVLQKYGKEATVLEMRNGNKSNFFSLLKETQSSFERQWRRFLKKLTP